MRIPPNHPDTLGKLVDKEHLTPPETGKRGEKSSVYILEVCIFNRVKHFGFVFNQ